jgi:ElaB/YqjD/DUF883 family membrane-anchored ribosome-binding protein
MQTQEDIAAVLEQSSRRMCCAEDWLKTTLSIQNSDDDCLLHDRFDAILPTIQRRWPEVARHTLEASRGSLDLVVDEISRQSGDASIRVKEQLLDLAHLTGEQARNVGDSLKPLEDQLEQLLDDLNSSLRPRLTKPVREKPLMALGIAAGVGLLLGMLLKSGRRSA